MRRFPWEDLYGQMQRYLAEEKERFAGMVAQAEEVVANLDAAIGKFRQDTDEYPRSLDELIERPERFSTGGNWPYVTSIPAYPWEQSYRYLFPGKFNPSGFDVYSVHGNSREPSVWIGNWPSPYRIRGALEGEDLVVKARSDNVTVSKQAVGVISAAFSRSFAFHPTPTERRFHRVGAPTVDQARPLPVATAIGHFLELCRGPSQFQRHVDWEADRHVLAQD